MTNGSASTELAPDGFAPHPVQWSPDRVRRFWDHSSTNPAMDDIYFAREVGKSLVNHVARKIRIGGAVDIGCGHGDLMDILMKRGHEVFGIDQSPATVEQVQRRFAGRKGFKGAVRDDGGIALPDESADTAFMVEVVEHLDDRALANLLREAHRIVRPGGHLVLTTPNEENLRGFESMCPECGCIFHRVQHVRSWSATSLTEHVRRFGFEPVSAKATVLAPFTGPMGFAYRTAYRLVRKRNPHLVYIGRRGKQ